MQLASWNSNNNNINSKQKSPYKRKSPCKQNQSPSKSYAQKIVNQNQLLEKLCNYLQDYGVTVPNQIIEKMKCLSQSSPNRIKSMKNSAFNGQDSFIKLEKVENTMPQISLIPSARSQIKSIYNNSNQLQEKNKIIKKLQVQLNDYQFQLKKLNEDFAQYKVLSRIQKEKQVRRYRDLYQDTQKRLKDENQNWQNRFKIKEDEYIQQLRAFKKLKQSQMNQSVSTQLKQKEQFYEKKISYLQQKNQNLKQELQTSKSTMQQVKQIQIQEVKKVYEIKITQVIKQKQQQNKQKIEQKQKELIQIQNVKEKTKIKLQQLQISTNKIKEKLYNDLYVVRRQNNQQKDKIQQVNKEKRALEYQIDKKKQQIQQIKAQHVAAQHFIQEKKEKIIQIIRQDKKKQIQSIVKENTQIINKFQQRLQEIEQQKNQLDSLHRNSQQQIAKLFQLRPSRGQDLNKIQRLQYDVMRRDQDLRITKMQLKKSKMQHENNQKVYNRIFSSATKHIDKKSLSKDHRDFLIRGGGHSMDMRYLLKVCTGNYPQI